MPHPQAQKLLVLCHVTWDGPPLPFLFMPALNMLSFSITDRLFSNRLFSECQNMLSLCAQGREQEVPGMGLIPGRSPVTDSKLQLESPWAEPVLVRPTMFPAPACRIEPMLSSAQLCLIFHPSCFQFLLASQKHFLQIIAHEFLCQSLLLRDSF